MDRVEKGMVTLRTTVIVTGISVVLRIAGLNAAIMQNMQAAFDSGRMVSASQAEVQRQIRETDANLRAIDLKLAKTDENLRETAVLLKEAKKLLLPPRRPGAR
jgi:5-bromo-4-chloroindolyl phosphate hydrolysis protein